VRAPAPPKIRPGGLPPAVIAVQPGGRVGIARRPATMLDAGGDFVHRYNLEATPTGESL